jgi:hypothetical protein
LSHNVRISFAAPSPFDIASCRIPSLKEDKTLRYGITPSSRCAYEVAQPAEEAMVTCFAHVHGGRAILGDLAPSKLRWVSFPKTEHPKHVSNPSRYTLHDFDVQFVYARVDINVGARDQVPQDVNRTGSIKGIAKRFSEPILGSIISFCAVVIRTNLEYIKHYALICQGTFRTMVPVVPIWNSLLRLSLTNQCFSYGEKVLPGLSASQK